MFLEQVNEGKNDTGRWIAMIIIVMVVSQLVGSIPLQISIFLKMSENPDLQPNPENHLDLSAYNIAPLTGFVLLMIPAVFGLVSILLLMKPLHERLWLSLLTGHPKFRWRNFFWGAKIWFVLLTIYSLIATLTGFQKVELQFNPLTLLTLFAFSILLLPFQTGFEEVLFRGYLMQGFSRLLKYKWLTLLLTSVIFGALHFFNPEVKEFGTLITLPQYIWFGIVFGVCTIMDEGLELAWGMHAINNIFLSLLFTQDSTALPTPALFRITAFNPLFDLISIFILTMVFIYFARRRFQWPQWNYLLSKVNHHDNGEDNIINYMEDEYSEEE